MIPFLDLRVQNQGLSEEINECFNKVVYENSYFILGPEGTAFENEFSKFCGKKYGVGVNSGTDALELALYAKGVKSGDEVIVPVNTAIPTAMAIKNIGAEPTFIDVNENYLMDISQIEDKISSKTKAILPVHLYGRSCDMDPIINLASKNNLEIIEDCCQAHGATYNGKKVPISDTGCFSFYPSKNLGALGDGGMILTNNEKLEQKLKLLRNYGQSDKYHASVLGRNTRLDELQASILRVKLNHLENWNAKRLENAKKYNSLLEDIVKTPLAKDSVFHLYVIQTNKRDELMSHLKKQEIGTLIHYPIPLHLQKSFSYKGHQEGDFLKSEKFSKEILSLPIFPELTFENIEKISKEIKDFF